MQIKNVLFSALFYCAASHVTMYASEGIVEESTHVKTCSVPPMVLETIAKVERHAKRAPGYPYIIAFNNMDDAKVVKQVLGNELFLDWRTIDCINSSICQKLTSYIVKEHKIHNMDLGAYQINYYYHKMPIDYYFSFEKSYIKACKYLETLISNHGYSWETIARYHSSTPQYNHAYLQKISTILKDSR